MHNPINRALMNSSVGKDKCPEILPPHQTHQNARPRGENLDNLKDFRLRMMEMDDEIQQLKNIEIGKHLNKGNNENDPRTSRMTPNKESLDSTQYLIQEQNKRIQELHQQLEELRSKGTMSKDVAVSANIETYDDETELTRRLNIEVARRIGNWSSRDPHQGPMDNLYFPFGSAGGGAPNRDSHGNVQTTVSGQNTLNTTTEERAKKILASHVMMESLKHEILDQRLRRLQDKQQSREPQRNFSELISTFKGGRPKRDPNTGIIIDNHLHSSDVTNIKLSTPRESSRERCNEIQTSNDDKYAQNYALDLSRAAEERQILKKIEKLREQQEVRQHMDSWDEIWGSKFRSHNSFPLYNYKEDPIAPQRSNHRNFYQLSDS